MQKNTNFVAFIFFIGVANIVFEPYLSRYGYIDEGLVALLMLQIVKHVRLFAKTIEFRVYVCIISLFLVYSLVRHVNVPQATLRDFFIFLKPFVCFYVSFLLGFNVTAGAKAFFRAGFILMGVYLWLILPNISFIYHNTTAYYPACIFVGVGYLLFSTKKRGDWLVATLFVVPGLASIRAKFFAEFIMWLGVLFFVKGHVKINIKYVVVGLIVLCLGYYVNQDKIVEYIFNGMKDDKARAHLYNTAFIIYKDFFPFGPGFGTYATDSAAKFYSPLNYRYHLNYVWGLAIEDMEMGHNYYSDTFYPILSQFGVVGTALYAWFWKRRWNEGKLIQSLFQYKVFLFMFSYLMIQCVAENTFTGSSSVPIMLVIGLCLSSKTTLFKTCGGT